MKRIRFDGRAKLVLSLILNLASRAPGALSLVVLLPMIQKGLGNADYATLLALMSLGALLSLPQGGANTIVRRRIGRAHATGDERAEANALADALVTKGLFAFGACAIAVAYIFYRGMPTELVILPAVGVVSALAATFDNARAAYNEHYWTATLQIIFQTLAVGVALLVPATRTNIVLASLCLQLHMPLASLATGFQMIRARPYLLRGRSEEIATTIKDGLLLSISDGLLLAVLNSSVVLMEATARAEFAAWYGTLVRFFQTLLAPVLLVVLPVASFVALKWANWETRRRQFMMRAIRLGALGYGLLAALALYVLDVAFIRPTMSFEFRIEPVYAIPLYVQFGAIIGYRAFSSIYFVIYRGPRLAWRVSIAALVAIGFGALVQMFATPLAALASVAICLTLTLALANMISIEKLMHDPTASPAAG
ncbi:hypothetical protein [Novosphingobium resinovorum]|uniref:Polysaccharide biosynthesis protein n=1 Tax=Novosphingobium resinovorum TaxID=158500 RepID=A0A1D8A5I4_9SPHN|nr:hypothetical protein [Novosphingobium resinovorum]AOR77370.1 hypothetical protein BES08_11870 [Novosphingobium resinovorum]